MKVICPECALEFNVPVDKLGARGRRVRCSGCGHIWLQEPEVENAFGGFRRFGEEDMAIEPIPPSVHPDTGGDDDDDDESGPGFFAGIDYGYLAKMMAGFVVGAALAAGVLYGLAQKGMVPRFLEPLAAALDLPYDSGDGFRVEIAAVVESKNEKGAPVSVVTGHVRNVSGERQAMPRLDVVPIDPDGTEGEGMRVSPAGEGIDPDQDVSFGAQLPGALPPGGKVLVRIRE